jgi:hypothetical protein
MKQHRNAHVADVETIINLFICVITDIDTLETKSFVVHPLRDDRNAFYEWLSIRPSLITFNGLKFDYPILHYIMINRKRFTNCDPAEFTLAVHLKGVDLINTEYPEIRNRMLGVQDVFRIHHFDNVAKRASLKWVQGNMYWHNMEELPVPPDIPVLDDDVVPLIKYCVNDVDSTFELYTRTIPMIELRKALGKKYGLNLINASDSKIGESILLKRIGEALGMRTWELKERRENPEKVVIKDCMLPITFESPSLNAVLKVFEKLSPKPEEFKGALNYSIAYDGMYYDFGLGGLHACRRNASYKLGAGYKIIDSDVKSYYPNLGITNMFYPTHLGESFCSVYKDMYEERLSYPKGTPENYALKIALNGAYGKSNEQWSALYDPTYTMKITVNGQLKLVQLCERQTLAGNQVLYVNTDGIICLVRDETAYVEICNQWETEHNGLELEHEYVDAAYIRDVNNLLIQYTNGKIKAKGDYEPNEDRGLHKDFSFNIVRIAVINFLIKQIPIETTIRECDDIYQFCLMSRTKRGDYFTMHYLKGDQVVTAKQGRYVRYVIVKTGGGTLIKNYDKGSVEVFHRGYKCRIANKVTITEAQAYDIDYSWYEVEARKLLAPLYKTQYEIQWDK